MLTSALLFAVCTFLLWGTTNFLISYGEKNKGIDPTMFAAVMLVAMGILGVVLFAYLFVRGDPITMNWKLVIPVAAGLLLGIGILTFAFAMSHSEMSTGATAAIATSNAVFTTLLALVFLRENMTFQEWVGIGTVVLGIIILRI
jgi:drug/metabolite transporter (DMT)-like permease